MYIHIINGVFVNVSNEVFKRIGHNSKMQLKFWLKKKSYINLWSIRNNKVIALQATLVFPP